MGDRQRRRDQARRMLAAEFEGLHPDWSPRRCLQEAELELRRRDENPHFAAELLRAAPQLYLPHRSLVSPEAEARAWTEHPVMQWVSGVVCGGADGRPAERRQLFAAMAHMSSSSRPEMQLSLRTIRHPAWAWAYRVSSPRAATSAAYETMHAMAHRHDAGLCIHANLAMVNELAALTTARGHARWSHPLRDLAIDGTLIAANVPQHAPKGNSKRARKAHERRIAGPDRPMAQYVVYKAGSIVANATGPTDA